MILSELSDASKEDWSTSFSRVDRAGIEDDFESREAVVRPGPLDELSQDRTRNHVFELIEKLD